MITLRHALHGAYGHYGCQAMGEGKPEEVREGSIILRRHNSVKFICIFNIL